MLDFFRSVGAVRASKPFVLLSLLPALLWLSLTFSGCSPRPSPFKATDITGSNIGGDFELPAHDGALRRLADFRGKLVVVFFGFTNCPDVCPTTLYTLAQAMKVLGAESLSVQVIMITVDPTRDTRQVLSRYVTSFDPRFIGLVPSEEALKQVAGMFKVFINRNKPNASGYYTVDHSTSSFVFDGEGRIRLLVPHTFSGQDWAADLRQLLHVN